MFLENAAADRNLDNVHKIISSQDTAVGSPAVPTNPSILKSIQRAWYVIWREGGTMYPCRECQWHCSTAVLQPHHSILVRLLQRGGCLLALPPGGQQHSNSTLSAGIACISVSQHLQPRHHSPRLSPQPHYCVWSWLHVCTLWCGISCSCWVPGLGFCLKWGIDDTENCGEWDSWDTDRGSAVSLSIEWRI